MQCARSKEALVPPDNSVEYPLLPLRFRLFARSARNAFSSSLFWRVLRHICTFRRLLMEEVVVV
jgi:hypothetical protein